MALDFYQQLPQIINPIAFKIGFLSVRWYSLMYIAGFLVVWFLLDWRIRKGETEKIQDNRLDSRKQTLADARLEKHKTQDTILDLLLTSFAGGLVGGRIGYVLFYDPNHFLLHPLGIISPFNERGNFEGLYGMSYYGALAGGIIGAYVFLKIKKLDFLNWADFVVPALPAGYFFGRIGNFLNGELFGRVTSSGIGMRFVANPGVLRYPSQIFEAFAEGLLLFVILWKIRNQKKNGEGFLLAAYILGYGVFRFVCEFFRNPDAQSGYLFRGLTMGQALSVISILILFFMLFLKNKKSAIIKIGING